MMRMAKDVVERAHHHDMSKFGEEEFPHYANVIEEFEKFSFGSDGYNCAREKLGIALKHHYENNRHHPEHFPNGIDDMNLIDILEMICDWKSATQNHSAVKGDISNSVEILSEKYKINPQLKSIIYNTLRDFKALNTE